MSQDEHDQKTISLKVDKLNTEKLMETSGEETANGLEQTYDAMVFPSLVVRIKALFVDLVVLLMVFTGTTLFIDAFGDISSFLKGSILIFMVYLYDPILTAFTGSTLGHKVMNLSVGRYSDPQRNISLPMAMLRFLTKGFLGWISFLTVTGNKRKRAIHDLVSGSIMTYSNTDR